jgi:hypothetical protein
MMKAIEGTAMKSRILVFTTLAVVSLLTTTAYAAPATEKSIKELMVLTGAGNMGVQMMQGMLPELKKMVPQVPQSFWDDFAKEIDPNELINMVVPIYAKHYTEEDIQAAIKFYKSPAGQRLIQQQPMVMQESMLAGQQWGRRVGESVLAKARKLHDEQKAK